MAIKFQVSVKQAWQNTGIQIQAGQEFSIYTIGRANPYPLEPAWKLADPTFADADGHSYSEHYLPHSFAHTPMMLLGKIGTSGTLIGLGKNYSGIAQVSGELHLMFNETTVDLGNNRTADGTGFMTSFIQIGNTLHEATSGCDLGVHTSNEPTGMYPISLRSGIKSESTTDLSINTPASELAFHRSYRQDKLTEADFPQVMGLGWMHNHNIYLDDKSSAENMIYAYLQDGGRGHFEEETSTLYRAMAGGTSTITIDTGSTEARYTLDATDQTFVFDSNGELQKRTWSNGEEWTYSYYESPHVADGKLKEVDDSYGRKLQFSYINNSGQFDHLQLWRVGDQDATGLDGSSPAGRYVEFSYVESALNGSATSNGPLLQTVRDVRGETWTYDWYGQDTGETDSNQANWLLQVISPSVDVNGDGSPDGSITVKDLTYTVSGSDITDITQKRGKFGTDPYLIETDYAFQPNGDNVTTETTAGKTLTHRFLGGVYQGPEDAAGNSSDQFLDTNYRPAEQIDANGNNTLLEWSSDGKQLTKVTDANGIETDFTYDTQDRLIASLDGEDRQTLYAYDARRRQPTLVIASSNLADPTQMELAINGDMEADSDWSDVGTPTTQAQSSTQSDSGGNARHVVTDAANEGIESSADVTLVDGNTYLLMARVYLSDITTPRAITLSLTGSNSFDVTSSTDEDEWQTLQILHTVDNTEDGAQKIRFIAAESGADFYVDTVHLIDLGVVSDIDDVRWQEFRYDDKGRVLLEKALNPDNGGTVSGQTERSYGNTGNGNGLLASVTEYAHTSEAKITSYDYDSVGRVIKTNVQSLFGTCQYTYTVYDDAGNVLGTACSQHGATPPSSVSDLQTIYNADSTSTTVTLHEYDELGRRVKTTSNAHSTIEQESRVFYDALNRPIRTISNYVQQGSSAPGNWVWDTADNRWEDGAGNPVSFGVENNENIISDTEYNQRGLLRLTRDVLGHVMLYGYDDADRLVKTIQNASDETYNNDYSDTGSDPDLSAYTEDTSQPDIDLITEQAYDPNGNLVKSIDILGNVSFTVYDALNRPIKTIVNAKDTARIDLNSGDTGYDATNDPRSSSYVASTESDRDLIQATSYDDMGRVVESTDVNGAVQRMVYDALGRTRLTIANYVVQGSSDPADWAWSTGNSQWEYSSGNAVSHGANNDQNIISETVYDVQGRVESTFDVEHRETRLVYDSLNRQVRAISNYVVQGSSDPANWVWDTNQWEDGANNPISHGTNDDQNIISETTYNGDGQVSEVQDVRGRVNRTEYDTYKRPFKSTANYIDGTYSTSTPDEDLSTTTTYDGEGRVESTTDSAGNVTRMVYDLVGRQVRTIRNYVVQGMSDPADWVWNSNLSRWEDGASNAIVHGSDFDQNIISEAAYNQAGQVVSTRDSQGTQTTVTYDAAGRRISTTLAANTNQATSSYTCFDKSGRVLRTIQNWVDNGTSPDAKVGGNWVFNPTVHGTNNDQNLITEFEYDAVSRRIKVTNPSLDVAETTYNKDGSVDAMTQKSVAVGGSTADVQTVYRYDALRRRTLVVQAYEANGEDPALWVWDNGDTQWETSNGTAIHSTDLDENIIVQVTYDIAGRVTAMRDPNGHLTNYTYDQLGRRTKLTNPLNQNWETAYENLSDGTTQTTMTYPGLATGGAYDVVRSFDRLGRLTDIQYNQNTTTPDVSFSYDVAGNRTEMTETDDVGTARKTTYSYDNARRLTNVGFDEDGNGTVDETVAYDYDILGRRTSLTFDGQTVSYEYDARGRLVALTDWDNQRTSFAFDGAGRHIATRRANGFNTDYAHDPSGRLLHLHHRNSRNQLLQQFSYQVDARGNRTQATELTPRTTAGSAVTILPDDPTVVYKGEWYTEGSFHVTDQWSAGLAIPFFGQDNIDLTIGTGPDHSIFDIYVNRTLWQSIDAYNATESEQTIPLSLTEDGPHLLEIRNRHEQNLASSGFKVRFKSLAAQNAVDETVIDYTYDGLARLLSADNGTTQYDYTYDLAGNRLSETIGANTTNFTYNDLNQLVSDGTNTFTYDANGNLTNDGANAYTWDRANRLTQMGGNSYAYDGAGDRISQTVSGVTTNYLTDIAAYYPLTIASTRNSETTRYVHGLRGIHAQQDHNNTWQYMLADGLGSVRGTVDAQAQITSMRTYAPYGDSTDVQGTVPTDYGYAGEMIDSNGLSYNRARYYNPAMGTFASLDPFEGVLHDPMSLNGYGYVHGNPINLTDPMGLFVGDMMSDLADAAYRAAINTTNNAIDLVDSIFGSCGETPVRDGILNALSNATDKWGDVTTAARQLTYMGVTAIADHVNTTSQNLRWGFGIEPLPPGVTRAGALARGILGSVEIAATLVDIAMLGGVATTFSRSIIKSGTAATFRAAAGVTGRGIASFARGAAGLGRAGARMADNFGSFVDDAYRAMRGACSFSADTIIWTSEGEVAIRDIKVGDMVLGFNEQAEGVDTYAVTATYLQRHESTLDITINGETIHTTDEHPFYVLAEGWVEAGELAVGDEVLAADGTIGTVEAIDIIDEPQVMYNLSVALVATYLVGEGQWVVHNQDYNYITDPAVQARVNHAVNQAYINTAFVDNAYNNRSLNYFAELYLPAVSLPRNAVAQFKAHSSGRATIYLSAAQMSNLGNGALVHAATHELQHATHASYFMHSHNIDLAAALSIMDNQADWRNAVGWLLTEEFVEDQAWKISAQTLRGQYLDDAAKLHADVVGRLSWHERLIHGIGTISNSMRAEFRERLKGQIICPL